MARVRSLKLTKALVGNKVRVRDLTTDRATWTYDHNNRLRSEHRTGTQQYRITHTYDLTDNRTVKEDTSGRTTFAYNAANELTTSLDSNGTTTYTYDADGNQATKTEPSGDITTNVWDSVNRLSSVILPAGATHTFVYAPNDFRVKSDDGSNVSKFLWDAKNLLLETNASDDTQALYTLNPMTFGDLLSKRDGSTSRFYHFDQLGSTLLLSDGTETPTSQYIYEAYGEILAEPAGITNPFTFVGRQGYQYDPHFLHYYLRARYYDPHIARFLSSDPVGFPFISNRYVYVNANPITSTDPSGLIAPALIACILGAAAGAIGSVLYDIANNELEACRSSVQAIVAAILGCASAAILASIVTSSLFIVDALHAIGLSALATKLWNAPVFRRIVAGGVGVVIGSLGVFARDVAEWICC